MAWPRPDLDRSPHNCGLDQSRCLIFFLSLVPLFPSPAFSFLYPHFPSSSLYLSSSLPFLFFLLPFFILFLFLFPFHSSLSFLSPLISSLLLPFSLPLPPILSSIFSLLPISFSFLLFYPLIPFPSSLSMLSSLPCQPMRIHLSKVNHFLPITSCEQFLHPFLITQSTLTPIISSIHLSILPTFYILTLFYLSISAIYPHHISSNLHHSLLILTPSNSQIPPPLFPSLSLTKSISYYPYPSPHSSYSSLSHNPSLITSSLIPPPPAATRLGSRGAQPDNGGLDQVGSRGGAARQRSPAGRAQEDR